MYVTITPQKLGDQFSLSSSNFVHYLDKENEGVAFKDRETFFSQNQDAVSKFKVINAIDSNTAKLKKTEARFYSITLNPSATELQAIGNTADLKNYTRKAMEEYAKHFNRQIQGRPITVKDLVYFAKIEKTRRFSHKDKQVLENRTLLKRIQANPSNKATLEAQLHRQNGQVISEGMNKAGDQRHIHIIISRKDKSNSCSLSPGSKYKASNTVFNGKKVQRGFNRNGFIEGAEKAFDRHFKLKRNYINSYAGQRAFMYDKKRFFKQLTGLPNNEQQLAKKVLGINNIKGVKALYLLKSIPVTPQQLAKRGIDLIVKQGRNLLDAGSINI